MARELTGRDRALLELARRETDPAHWRRFQPITRGPVVALLGMGALAAFVPFFIVTTLFLKALGRR